MQSDRFLNHTGRGNSQLAGSPMIPTLLIAALLQFWPFPGPGTIAHSGGGGGTPTFVQANICEASTTSTTITCAFASNITANNLVVAIGRWDDATTRTATFSSLSGVTCTWNTAVAKFISGGNNQGVQWMYCVVPSSGAETMQYVLSGNSTFRDLVV